MNCVPWTDAQIKKALFHATDLKNKYRGWIDKWMKSALFNATEAKSALFNATAPNSATPFIDSGQVYSEPNSSKTKTCGLRRPRPSNAQQRENRKRFGGHQNQQNSVHSRVGETPPPIAFTCPNEWHQSLWRAKCFTEGRAQTQCLT